jgi:hypothetical protein
MTDLEKINHQLLFILGVSLTFVIKATSDTSRDEQLKKWILKAVDNVVYKNIPMPEFPK